MSDARGGGACRYQIALPIRVSGTGAPPPMWAAMAADDPLFGKTDYALLPAWQAKGGAVELHLYEHGGHGFGYPGRKATSSTQWPDDFLAWLKARGLLGKSG